MKRSSVRTLGTAKAKALGPGDRTKHRAEVGLAEGVLRYPDVQPRRKCVPGALPKWCGPGGSACGAAGVCLWDPSSPSSDLAVLPAAGSLAGSTLGASSLWRRESRS